MLQLHSRMIKQKITQVFSMYKLFTFCVRCVWSDVVYTLNFSFCFWSLTFCQLEACCLTLTHLRLVHSPTQTHSANCWLVLHTPDQNHRQDDCGFIGQRKQRCPQKQTQTLKHCEKYTNSPLWSRINKNTDLHTLDWHHVWGLSKFFIQTLVSEMVENPKWRPWLRFQRDMTIQCCNYMCCNALWIILV